MVGLVDVNALRLMQAIRDGGSLTAAAGVLGVSQPAVSQHVRRLEKRLGTSLVVRSGRSMRLTEAGQVLARHGEGVSAALRAAEAEIASLTGLQAGQVRLVAFPSASAVLVPRALALLRRRHPGISVTLEEVEPPASIQLVRAGTADVALAFSYQHSGGAPADAPTGASTGASTRAGARTRQATPSGIDEDLVGLEVTPLLADATLLAVPADHRLATLPEPALRDAAGERWIAGCPRCRGQLLESASESGFVPEIAFATDDYSAVLGLVAAGLGVALLPGLVRAAARGHDGVVLRQASGVADRAVHAVTSPELLGVPAVAALITALRDAVAADSAP